MTTHSVPNARPDASPDDLPRTEQTRIHRYAKLQSHDRTALYALLDEALLAHVGFGRGDGAPVGVIPMGYARDGGSLLLHGSTRSGVLQPHATRAPLTATVTLLDGLVYAETLYDSTFNFRSAVLTGTADAVTDRDQKILALQVLSERLMPGRWPHVPELTEQQLAATLVLRLPIDVVSLKIREGAPDEAPGPLWTGVVPLRLERAAPQPQPGTVPDIPAYVAALAGPPGTA